MYANACKPGHSDPKAVCYTAHSHWELTVVKRHLRGSVWVGGDWITSLIAVIVVTHLLWDEVECIHINSSSEEPLVQYQQQSDPEWRYELVDHLEKQQYKVDSLQKKNEILPFIGNYYGHERYT